MFRKDFITASAPQEVSQGPQKSIPQGPGKPQIWVILQLSTCHSLSLSLITTIRNNSLWLGTDTGGFAHGYSRRCPALITTGDRQHLTLYRWRPFTSVVKSEVKCHECYTGIRSDQEEPKDGSPQQQRYLDLHSMHLIIFSSFARVNFF